MALEPTFPPQKPHAGIPVKATYGSIPVTAEEHEELPPGKFQAASEAYLAMNFHSRIILP